MWLLNLNHWIVKKKDRQKTPEEISLQHTGLITFIQRVLYTHRHRVRKSQKSRENKDTNRKFKTVNDQ